MEISKEISLALEHTQALVSELQAHDLLRVDDPAGAIDYAYPFTKRTTEHRVELTTAS